MWRLIVGILILLIALGTIFSDDPGQTVYWVGGLVLGPYLIFSYFKHRRDDKKNAVIEGALNSNETYITSKLEQDSVYDIGKHLSQLNSVPPIYAYQFIANLILTKYGSRLTAIMTIQKQKWSPKITPENELDSLSYAKDIYAYQEDLIGLSMNEPDDYKGAVLLTTGYLYFFKNKSDFIGKITDVVNDRAIENSIVYGLGWTAYTLATDIKKDIEAVSPHLIKTFKSRLHEKHSLAIDLRFIKKAEIFTRKKRINLINQDLIGVKVTFKDDQTFSFFHKDKTTKTWAEEWLTKIRFALIPQGIAV